MNDDLPVFVFFFFSLPLKSICLCLCLCLSLSLSLSLSQQPTCASALPETTHDPATPSCNPVQPNHQLNSVQKFDMLSLQNNDRVCFGPRMAGGLLVSRKSEEDSGEPLHSAGNALTEDSPDSADEARAELIPVLRSHAQAGIMTDEKDGGVESVKLGKMSTDVCIQHWILICFSSSPGRCCPSATCIRCIRSRWRWHCSSMRLNLCFLTSSFIHQLQFPPLFPDRPRVTR
jgi:hypothetical protein